MGCSDQLIVPRFSQNDINNTVKNGTLLTMEIEFNSVCNFSCTYCYLDNTRKNNELDRDQFRDLIRQAHGLGVRLMVILGGEPMLYPHLMEMIQYMRELGMDAEIFTNGANITGSTASLLFENNVSVILKCNSFSESVQDQLCGKNGAYKTIHSALSALKNAGYPSDNGHLGISTVICKQNFSELLKLWKWIRDQRMTPYFEMLTPQGNAKDNKSLEVEPQKVQDLFYKLADIDKTYGFDWEPQPPLIGAKCVRHQYSCVVNSIGDVVPCVGVNIPVGNVKENTLKDILGGSKVIKELRNYKEHIKGPCASCEELEHCYGCRGAAFHLTGDYLASDPLCWKNKDKAEEIYALPSDAKKLVPHEPPMLIVDKLVDVKDDHSSIEVTVSKDTVFARANGEIEEVAYIEMIAQAMAAHNGYKNLGEPEPTQEAFMVGASRVKVYDHAKVGDTLRVDVSKIAEYNGTLAVINGQIFKGSKKLAEGEIKVWYNAGKPAALA